MCEKYLKNLQIGGQGNLKDATRREDEKEGPILNEFAENWSQDGGPTRWKFIKGGTSFLCCWHIVLEQFGREDGAEVHPKMDQGINGKSV